VDAGRADEKRRRCDFALQRLKNPDKLVNSEALVSVLFHFAVMQSEQEGFHGRVGLHALPQAESFYAGQECRMTKVGLDPNKQNPPYYELSQIEAVQHIRNRGAT
jgi:hypothetical protein